MMRELKMPHIQNEASRPKLKKPRKITPKSLVDDFDSVTEEMSPTTFFSSTPLDEVSFSLLDRELPELSEMSIQSDLTSSLEIKSVENAKPEMDCGSDGIGDLEITSLEVQIAVSALRKAATEILNADSVDSQSKKLLSKLVEVVVLILEPLPEEKDYITEILAVRTRIVTCFFLLCVFAAFAARLLLSWGSESSYGKPPPT